MPPPLAGAPPSTLRREGRDRRAANAGGDGSRRPARRGARRRLADGGAGAAGGAEGLQRDRSSLPRRRPHLVRIRWLGDVTASPRLDPAVPPRDGLNSSRSDGRRHASAPPPHPLARRPLVPAGRVDEGGPAGGGGRRGWDAGRRVWCRRGRGGGQPAGAHGLAGGREELDLARDWGSACVFFLLLVWFTGALPGIRCLVGFSCAER
ncbi:unnamed protein product [Urochloa humidicola]